jgi:hypothetical protein
MPAAEMAARSPGARVAVWTREGWQPATVVRDQGSSLTVRYDRFIDGHADESVSLNRIRGVREDMRAGAAASDERRGPGKGKMITGIVLTSIGMTGGTVALGALFASAAGDGGAVVKEAAPMAAVVGAPSLAFLGVGVVLWYAGSRPDAAGNRVALSRATTGSW